MHEASSTYIDGSIGGTWAIIIVAVLALAFLIAAVQIANVKQDKDGRHAGDPSEEGPVPGQPVSPGHWAAGGVPGVEPEEYPDHRGHEPIVVPGSVAGGEAAGPARPGGPSPMDLSGGPVPAPRSGGDQAARSQAAAGGTEPGR